MISRGPRSAMGGLQNDFDAGGLGGRRPGGTERLDLPPDRLHPRRGEDDEIAGLGEAEAEFGRFRLLVDLVDPVRRAAGGPRPFAEQAHDLALAAAAVVRRLPEDEDVEELGPDLAHLADVGLAPVAWNADHADAALTVRLERRHDAAEGSQGVGVMGVVEDHPEAVV